MPNFVDFSLPTGYSGTKRDQQNSETGFCWPSMGGKADSQATKEQSPVPSIVSTYFSDLALTEPSQPVKDNDLIKAAAYGRLASVEYLLERGADPTFGDHRAFYIASANGRYDVAKLLLAKAPPPKTVDEALLKAAGAGYADVVNLLVGYGVEKSIQKRALNLAEKQEPAFLGAVDARCETPVHGHSQSIDVLRKAMSLRS